MGRIRQTAAALNQLRTGRPDGVRDAVRRRLAQHSGADELRAVVEQQAAELAALRAELAEANDSLQAQGRTLEGLTARIDGLDSLYGAREHMTRWLEDHGRALGELDRRVEAASPHAALDQITGWLRSHDTAFQGLHLRTDELEGAQAVRIFTHWLDQLEPATGPRISVVMPTHNRAALLPRAVASVLAQSYPDWELVIVDDASADHTPDVIAAFEDPRIRSIRTAHGGVCAARNAGLAEASGEVIAYLDDDNTMHPSWLKTLAWAFGQHKDVETVYGGFVIDDLDRVHGLGAGSLPKLMLRPYDREVLLRENLADIGAVGHRAGLPAARFDESLVEMGDWDILCALTEHREPFVVPAISCYYATDAPGRLSNGPTYDADFAAVRRKHAPELTL